MMRHCFTNWPVVEMSRHSPRPHCFVFFLFLLWNQIKSTKVDERDKDSSRGCFMRWNSFKDLTWDGKVTITQFVNPSCPLNSATLTTRGDELKAAKSTHSTAKQVINEMLLNSRGLVFTVSTQIRLSLSSKFFTFFLSVLFGLKWRFLVAKGKEMKARFCCCT